MLKRDLPSRLLEREEARVGGHGVREKRRAREKKREQGKDQRDWRENIVNL